VQPLGGGLEAALAHDRVEALQLVEREAGHCRASLQSTSDLCNSNLQRRS
jgi:hypothetical protein